MHDEQMESDHSDPDMANFFAGTSIKTFLKQGVWITGVVCKILSN